MLQYFLKHFWNDHKCHRIWTLGPRTDHQNTSKRLHHLCFFISENMKLWFCWKVCVPIFRVVICFDFHVCFVLDLGVVESWKIKCWFSLLECEFMEFHNFVCLRFEVSGIEIRHCEYEFSVWEIDKFQFSKTRSFLKCLELWQLMGSCKVEDGRRQMMRTP